MHVTTRYGSGSGFVVDPAGYILTNAHVVERSDGLTVHFDDGASLPAWVVSSDATRDMALLKTESTRSLTPLRFASDAREGEEVVALGYPFSHVIGESMSVTTGIVSSFRTYEGVAHLQTDTDINPGNSGGPLLNLRGEVVGMNARGLRGGDAQGINFAIRYDVLASRLPILRAEAVEPVTPSTKILNHRVSSAVSKLSPFTGVSGYVGLIDNMIMSRLWQVDPHEQGYIPDIVERWDTAPDGSAVTFYMRKNAVWHDGEPVTAEDLEFSFTLYMDYRTKSRHVGKFAMVKGADAFARGTASSVSGITVIDHHTLTVEMAFPSSQFVAQAGGTTSGLGLYLLPKHLLSSIPVEDIDDHDFFIGLSGNIPIGTGPWKFVKHEPDQFHELVANEDYHFGAPKIDRVFVHLIQSADSAQIAMQRGEVDTSRRGGFTPEVNGTFLADSRFLVAATGRRNNGSGYSFNFRTEWIRDSRIHQAHMWALNRRQLVDTFEGGLGFIHNTNLFVPTGVETPEMMARYTHEGDTAKARQLLEEAGWDFDREITEKAPGYTGQALVQFAAEQQMLADAGLKVKYETMETPVWASVYYENYNYDSVRVGGWAGAVDAMDYYFHSTLSNPMGYANPRLDALLDAVPRALTNQKLVELGIKMNEMFIEDLPIVVISSPLRLFTYGAHVWVPGFGRRPQPNRLKDIQFTPEYHGQDDSWNYLIHQTDIVYFGDIHPLNLTGPIAKQIAIQGP